MTVDCLYRVSAKAIVYNDKWEFLLAKEHWGFWWFPGGWVEYWETIEEWLRREVKEEMWLEISEFIGEVQFFWLFWPWSYSFWKLNLFYEVKLKGLDFTPSDECVEIGFFDNSTALKLPLARWVKEVCNKL